MAQAIDIAFRQRCGAEPDQVHDHNQPLGPGDAIHFGEDARDGRKIRHVVGCIREGGQVAGIVAQIAQTGRIARAERYAMGQPELPCVLIGDFNHRQRQVDSGNRPVVQEPGQAQGEMPWPAGNVDGPIRQAGRPRAVDDLQPRGIGQDEFRCHHLIVLGDVFQGIRD